MRILKSHLGEMLLELDEIKEEKYRTDDGYATIAIGYQVLALFLLETGSYVPEIVKEEVLYSTIREYDKRWGIDRKEFLKKLREAVKNQEPGKNTNFSFSFIVIIQIIIGATLA